MKFSAKIEYNHNRTKHIGLLPRILVRFICIFLNTITGVYTSLLSSDELQDIAHDMIV